MSEKTDDEETVVVIKRDERPTPPKSLGIGRQDVEHVKEPSK